MGNDKDFTPGLQPPAENSKPAWWFAFRENKLLVRSNGSSAAIPFTPDLSTFGLKTQRQHFLGHLGESPCYAVELAEGISLPEGLILEGLRQVYGRVDEELFWLAARAIQIVDWDRTHQFCSRCGSPTVLRQTERSRECPKCGHVQADGPAARHTSNQLGEKRMRPW